MRRLQRNRANQGNLTLLLRNEENRPLFKENRPQFKEGEKDGR